MWIPGSILNAPALFLAGTAASAHCAVMCGTVSAQHARAGGGLAPKRALAWIYSGRIIGYAGLGMLLGTLGQSVLRHFPPTWSGRALQACAALFVAGIGLRLLLARQAAPACCQPPVSQRMEGWPLQMQLLARGLVWALLPCSLLYSVLLLAAFSGNAIEGGLLAGAFALGGTPVLALIGWRSVRRPRPGSSRATGWWLLGLGLAGLAGPTLLPASGAFAWCSASAGLAP